MFLYSVVIIDIDSVLFMQGEQGPPGKQGEVGTQAGPVSKITLAPF